jgi:hypothetical protein
VDELWNLALGSFVRVSTVIQAQNIDVQQSIRKMVLSNTTIRFAQSPYADPTSLHGGTMLGVSELASRHQEIAVSYSELRPRRSNHFRDSGQALDDSRSPLVWCPVIGARIGCEAGVR